MDLGKPISSSSPAGHSDETVAVKPAAVVPQSASSVEEVVDHRPVAAGPGSANAPLSDQPAAATASHLASKTPTSTIDPNVPSSESAPTALPTNPSTHPEEQKEAIKNEHPAVIHREVEKTKAAAREIKGEKPKGTVVAGLEDDRLWQMLRRFDVVSWAVVCRRCVTEQ